MANNTKTAEEVKSMSFEDLLNLPESEPSPDVVDGTPLTDEQRGAIAAKDRLAERMGAEAADIHVVVEDLSMRLMEGGVVVDIDIHRWTGMKRLLPKELGLNGQKAKSKAIRLGEKLLMPPTIMRSLNSLTTQLRANLDRYSFQTVWGRWVPATAYQDWKRRHDQLAEEYMKLGHAIADNLDQIKTSSSGTWGELRKLYAEHARAVWCRLNSYPVDAANMDMCPGSFVERYIQEIFSHMPAAEEIRRSFDVEAHISFIPLPSMLEEDRVRRDRLWEQAAEEREADQRRIAAQEQMEADVRAHYMREKSRMIDDFLGSLASEVYSRVYDVTSRALATMARNQGRVLEPTLRQLSGLVEWAEQMNITNDQALATAIGELKGMIARGKDARDAGDIKTQLENMGLVARSVLVDLNVEPAVADSKLSIAARDGVLNIGKRLSRSRVDKAREALGVAEVPELEIVQARRPKRGAFQNIPQI